MLSELACLIRRELGFEIAIHEHCALKTRPKTTVASKWQDEGDLSINYTYLAVHTSKSRDGFQWEADQSDESQIRGLETES